jgi:hypothetical protein
MKSKLKVIQPRAIGSWVLSKGVWHREMEAGVLCNFKGHGGSKTVGDLVEALKKLPQNGTFTIDEDESSGRMCIFVSWNEERVATEEELRGAREQAAKSEMSEALLKKVRRRQEIENQLTAVRAAMDGVREQLKSPFSSVEDLYADLETLKVGEAQLEAELANL